MNTKHPNQQRPCATKRKPLISPMVKKMIEEIAKVPDLAEQTMLFTKDAILGGTETRWNCPGEALNWPWIAWKSPEDVDRLLIVHSTRCQKILILESSDGRVWRRQQSAPYELSSQVIPKPYQRTSWMAKNASERQMEVVSKMANIPVAELPTICCYNINAIMHTKAMIPKRKAVEGMIREWEIEIETAGGTQATLFSSAA